MSEYLSVQDVAALAGCSTKTVRRAIAANRLHAFRVGSRLKIRSDHARAWIEADPVTVAAPSEHRPRERSGLRSVERGGFADSMDIYRKAARG